MIVVWKAEFAQSYIAHARRSGRPRPSRSSSFVIVVSVGAPGDPLPEQRIDDGVAAVFAGEDVYAQERAKRGLHGRRSAEAMTGTHVGRQQLAPVFEDGGAQGGPLRQRQALPGPLEKRFVFAQQPLQRLVQILEAGALAAAGLDVVPHFVRETLDVVGQVAGEVDDRAAEPGLRLEAGAS